MSWNGGGCGALHSTNNVTPFIRKKSKQRRCGLSVASPVLYCANICSRNQRVLINICGAAAAAAENERGCSSNFIISSETIIICKQAPRAARLQEKYIYPFLSDQTRIPPHRIPTSFLEQRKFGLRAQPEFLGARVRERIYISFGRFGAEAANISCVVMKFRSSL